MFNQSVQLAGGAQVEGWMMPHDDGSVSHYGPIWHDQRMEMAIASGSLEPLRPVKGLSVNGVLREDEFEFFDRAVINAYLDELVAFSDLESRGLTFGLGNAMGTTELKWEDVDQVGPAQRSMYAGTEPEGDLSKFTTRRLPIPIISKGFHLDLRTLSAGRREGEAIDVTNAERASRSVSESIDDLFFNGGFSHAGISVFGYTTEPNRNTVTIADWSNPATTTATILADAIALVDAAFQDNVPGPYVLYLPFEVVSRMNEDFKADSDKTLRQRILDIEGISGIRWTRRLAATEVALVAMNRQVVDAVVGFRPTLVQWETQGGMVVHFKVMSIIVPRVKRDADGRSGIVHGTV